MMILLVQPCKRKQFYKNPHKLQAIHLEAYPFLSDTKFIIWDRDTSHTPLFSHCDILVIDGTEGNLDAIRFVLSKVTSKTVLLIDLPFSWNSTLEGIYPAVHTVSLSDAATLLIQITHGRTSTPTSSISSPQLLMPPPLRDEYVQRGVQFFIEGVARGCEGNCSFCHLSKQSRKYQLVPYSAAECIRQAEQILPAPLFVQFTDENFFGSYPERKEGILSLTRELRQNAFKGYLGVDTRLDSLPIFGKTDKKCWNEMENVGLRYCFLGIESIAQSQARRYNKIILKDHLDIGRRYLEDKKLTFTLGLILWDPLMTIDELTENIHYIQSEGLLGKTASLLKPLRLHQGGLYMQMFGARLNTHSTSDSSGAPWDSTISVYQDEKIRLMARLLFPVYGFFNNAGYRHSDVSLFETLLDSSASFVYKDIPTRIARLEIDCIETLLSLPLFELQRLSPDFFLPACVCTAKSILYDMAAIQNQHPVIHNYYRQTLTDALGNIVENT